MSYEILDRRYVEGLRQKIVPGKYLTTHHSPLN